MSPQLPAELTQVVRQHGAPLRVSGADDAAEYVIMTGDQFQRIANLLVDDTDPNLDEFLPLAHAAFEEAWDAPGMELYDRF
jgi:hypothetical protein